VKHREAAVLFDGKVAKEAAHSNNERGPVNAPLQDVHEDGDAAAVLEGSPVARTLGHQSQRCGGVLEDAVVVTVLSEEVHHSRNRTQACDNGVRTFNNAQSGKHLQAILDHDTIGWVAFQEFSC